ncbi:hypothetical protein TOC8171_46830 [Pseudomonas syringae]
MYTFSQKILKNYLVKPPPALGKTNVYVDSYKYYVSNRQSLTCPHVGNTNVGANCSAPHPPENGSRNNPIR